MSEGPPPETPVAAARVFIAGLALAVIFRAVEKFDWPEWHEAAIWGLVALVLTVVDIKLSWVVQMVGLRASKTLNLVATDARWWIGSLLAIFIFVGLSPLLRDSHAHTIALSKAPVKVTSYEIVPFVLGTDPEVRIHLKNSGDFSLRVALQYDPYTNSQAIDEFSARQDLEERLWARFEAGLNLITTRRLLVNVPSNQDAWIPMKAIDVIQNDSRYYFLSRLFDDSGKKIFDSCVFVDSNSASAVKYCVNHND
jgi:hypothetical protein